MAKHPNDARLWAQISGLLRDAGMGPADRELLARRAVALVRRERATTTARTFAPGDEIPYDVTRVYDLDGDEWARQGQPPSTLKDTWNMTGYNPGEHEPAAGGAWITPLLLERYGPLTEIPPRKPKGDAGA